MKLTGMKYPDDDTGLTIQTCERHLEPSGKKPSEEMSTGKKIVSTGKKLTEHLPDGVQGPGVTTRSKKREGLQRPSGKKVVVFTGKKVVSTGKKFPVKRPDGVQSPGVTTRSKKREGLQRPSGKKTSLRESSGKISPKEEGMVVNETGKKLRKGEFLGRNTGVEFKGTYYIQLGPSMTS